MIRTRATEALRLLLFPLLLTGIVSTSYAQSLTPILNGQVWDPARAAVSGATITATADGQDSEATTVSDQNGEFSLSLSPGHYTIRIAAQGFSGLSESLDLAV